MAAQNRCRSGFGVGLSLLLSLTPVGLSADAPNATISGGNIQLFKSYPNFGPSTLLKFRLSAGPAVAVIPNGTRVQATAVKVVGNQEWFEVTYVAGGRSHVGWIYAGDVGDRRYLRLDAGAERGLRRAQAASGASTGRGWALVGRLLEPSHLHAQTSDPVAVPPIGTDPLLTLLIAAAYTAVFLAAMVVVKRWLFPTSNAYTFAMSFTILLLLGAITQTIWADLIGVAVAQGSP